MRSRLVFHTLFCCENEIRYYAVHTPRSLSNNEHPKKGRLIMDESKFIQNLPDVLRALANNPYGLVAFAILIVGFIAIKFFPPNRTGERTRILIFVIVILVFTVFSYIGIESILNGYSSHGSQSVIIPGDTPKTSPLKRDSILPEQSSFSSRIYETPKAFIFERDTPITIFRGLPKNVAIKVKWSGKISPNDNLDNKWSWFFQVKTNDFTGNINDVNYRQGPNWDELINVRGERNSNTNGGEIKIEFIFKESVGKFQGVDGKITGIRFEKGFRIEIVRAD